MTTNVFINATNVASFRNYESEQLIKRPVIWVINLLAIILLFVSSSVAAQIAYREVTVTGYGINISEAVVDALENAISQVNGQRLSSSTSLRLMATQENNASSLAESFERNIQKATQGVVKSYKLKRNGVGSDGRAFAEIDAVIPTYQRSDQLKRLKLAIPPVSLGLEAQKRQNASRYAEAVSAALEAHLTQTRKFAILDRRHVASTNRELAFVLQSTSAVEEAVRLGARVSADYVVLPILKTFEFKSQQTQRLSGGNYERIRAPHTIDIRVIDIATGQVKFARTYVHRGFVPVGYGLERIAQDVASEIGEMINFAIYPVAVLAPLGGNRVTLNQGGETLSIGRRYRLIRLGNEVTDPYTKESLGLQEYDIGTIEIITVTDRTAVAKLVDGVLPESFKPGNLIIRSLELNSDVTNAVLGKQQSGDQKTLPADEW